MGTMSMMASPGLTTPPTVLTSICLTLPRTGLRTSVRVTRSPPAVRDSRTEPSSVRRLLISWLMASCSSATRLPMRCRASSIMACVLGMAAASISISPWVWMIFCSSPR